MQITLNTPDLLIITSPRGLWVDVICVLGTAVSLILTTAVLLAKTGGHPKAIVIIPVISGGLSFWGLLANSRTTPPLDGTTRTLTICSRHLYGTWRETIRYDEIRKVDVELIESSEGPSHSETLRFTLHDSSTASPETAHSQNCKPPALWQKSRVGSISTIAQRLRHIITFNATLWLHYCVAIRNPRTHSI